MVTKTVFWGLFHVSLGLEMRRGQNFTFRKFLTSIPFRSWKFFYSPYPQTSIIRLIFFCVFHNFVKGLLWWIFMSLIVYKNDVRVSTSNVGTEGARTKFLHQFHIQFENCSTMKRGIMKCDKIWISSTRFSGSLNSFSTSIYNPN